MVGVRLANGKGTEKNRDNETKKASAWQKEELMNQLSENGIVYSMQLGS